MYKIYDVGEGRITGVYQIKNKINGKSYVGSSINIRSRFSNHMNRDSRRYYWRDFYKDVVKYGRNNFEFIILEECNKEDLLTREKYWYDKIKPEYNFDIPTEQPFKLNSVKKLAKETDRYKQSIINRKTLYNTEKYKNLFSQIQNKRKRKVDMYKNNVLICSFDSLSDAARYIDNNTDYKGKNKVSKIKEVCDNKRSNAYSYVFKYKV